MQPGKHFIFIFSMSALLKDIQHKIFGQNDYQTIVGQQCHKVRPDARFSSFKCDLCAMQGSLI